MLLLESRVLGAKQQQHTLAVQLNLMGGWQGLCPGNLPAQQKCSCPFLLQGLQRLNVPLRYISTADRAQEVLKDSKVSLAVGLSHLAGLTSYLCLNNPTADRAQGVAEDSKVPLAAGPCRLVGLFTF